MPLLLVRNDITHMAVDAIVNAANESLLGGGGVDGAIHAAAGPKLLEACRRLGGCRTGEARFTLGYNLPARYVIHTVGPVYRDGKQGEETLLRRCYRNSLALAHLLEVDTLAFPLISAGVYGYPREEAVRIAEEEIRAFLQTHDMTVYLVFFSHSAMEAGKKRFPDIARFIDDAYVDAHTDYRREYMRENRQRFSLNDGYGDTMPAPMSPDMEESCEASASCASLPGSLTEYITRKDEGFSTTLLSLIDSRGMTDAQCYKKANVDRKLFSKIRTDKSYRPSKSTVLAFALALELTLEETETLLKRAGYALSHAFVQDIIVEYFILSRQYDIFAVNEALFAFDQPLLGGR